MKKADPIINSYGISGVVALISTEWVLAFQRCLTLSLFLHPYTWEHSAHYLIELSLLLLSKHCSNITMINKRGRCFTIANTCKDSFRLCKVAVHSIMFLCRLQETTIIWVHIKYHNPSSTKLPLHLFHFSLFAIFYSFLKFFYFLNINLHFVCVLPLHNGHLFTVFCHKSKSKTMVLIKWH